MFKAMLHKSINLMSKVGNEGNKNPEEGHCCATQHFSINKQFALYNISAVTIATIPLRKISKLQACLFIPFKYHFGSTIIRPAAG